MTKEARLNGINGWLAVLAILVALFFGVWMLYFSAANGGQTAPFLIGAGVIVLSIFSGFGFYNLQPNEAAVMLLFGDYRGTVRTDGLLWTNPLYTKQKISLRARNLNGEKLKVNDKTGNPIEIGAVIVWRIEETAKAVFEVDDYLQFVTIQSEAALRHLATSFPYDSSEQEMSLRRSTDEVAEKLQQELQNRLAQAGVRVLEARLTHLAYAPEIAQAMLRRQQAEAVIAAREKIVHGAVSMVDMALKELAQKQVISLDEDRKAAMVSNLLVILCGESEAQPVINTGTLYS